MMHSAGMFTLHRRLLQKQAPAALSSEEFRDMEAAFEALDIAVPAARRADEGIE